MDLFPASITPKAMAEIKAIMATKNIPEDYGLRIGISGGGCGGMSFVLGFDKKEVSDIEYTLEEITIYIDKKHAMYLLGMEVDFYEGADARGFVFASADKVKGK